MITEEEKNKKAIAFYKNFVKSIEEELGWMYKQDEEYYRDEIEQSELLIIGFKRILNLITKLQEENKKEDKAIDLIIQHILLGKTFMQEVCPNTTVNNCNNFRKNGGCNECIKQYFINKVEGKDE